MTRILGATLLSGIMSCSGEPPYDAVARLKPEPGPVLTVSAAELIHEDAQRFLIACPGTPADTITDIAGAPVKVPSDGYDGILNGLISITSDGGVTTQRIAREEIDLCSEGFADPLTPRYATTEFVFRKYGTQWRLQGKPVQQGFN